MKAEKYISGSPYQEMGQKTSLKIETMEEWVEERADKTLEWDRRSRSRNVCIWELVCDWGCNTDQWGKVQSLTR